MRHFTEPLGHDRSRAATRTRCLALLIAASFATPASAGAVVEACRVGGQPVREHGLPINYALDYTQTPVSSLSAEERERFRYPLPEAVADHPRSFWDLVPAEFWLILGTPKEEVEQFDRRRWNELAEHFLWVRAQARRLRLRKMLAKEYGKIDWLYYIATRRESVSRAEYRERGLRQEIKIHRSQHFRVGQGMNAGRAWMMVAGLWVRDHLDTADLIGDADRQYHLPDGYWQRFPRPDGDSWFGSAEVMRVREYLCSHPSIKYLIYRAQKYAADPNPTTRTIGEGEQRAISQFIDDNIADFEAVRELLAPGSAGRQQYLDLVPSRHREQAEFTLQTEGAAKSYIALRDKTLVAMSRLWPADGVTAYWDALAPAEKYVWPDACLPHLSYPGYGDGPGDLFGWFSEKACAAYSKTREQIYAKYAGN